MFKKVLVALDGSETAEGILFFVSRLAKGLKLSVVLVSVLDPESLGFGDPLGEVSGSLSRRARDEIDPSFPVPQAADAQRLGEMTQALERYLEGVAKRLRKQDLEAEWAVTVGHPAEEILHAAESKGCGLIALSSYSEDTEPNGTVGSVTVKVLHGSHIPLLVLNPKKALDYRDNGMASANLLVPLDGSALGEMALPYAEELSRCLALPLTLVRAQSSLNTAFVADPAMGMALTEEMSQALDAEASDYLARVQSRLAGEGVAAKTQLLKGAAAKVIVELAQRSPDSLIVMTSHGRSSFARWLLGSVTEGVVRTAQNAVLVVPRQSGKHRITEVTALLEQTPVFARLSADDLERVAQAARIRTYPAGELIVREGETTGGFFIITLGKVEVLKGHDLAAAKVLDKMEAGAFFGEMSIVDEAPRSASVRAVEPTECVVVRRVDFMRLMEQRPEIAVRLLPELVKRLREARENPMV